MQILIHCELSLKGVYTSLRVTINVLVSIELLPSGNSLLRYTPDFLSYYSCIILEIIALDVQTFQSMF